MPLFKFINLRWIEFQAMCSESSTEQEERMKEINSQMAILKDQVLLTVKDI